MATETLILIAAVYLLAGFVKGVVGMGMPTVALALLAATLGVKPAIALMIVPALVTNIWQALIGDSLRALLRRLGPLLLAACLGIWLGAGLLAGSDARLITGLLGLLLVGHAGAGLADLRPRIPGGQESWLSPLVGALNGVVTGLTGSAVPGVLYLQALGLPRDTLIQAMGLLFTVSSLVLGLALASHALLPAELGLASALALVPAVAGMMLGQRLRRRLAEERFRQVFLVALLLLGLYLLLRAVL